MKKKLSLPFSEIASIPALIKDFLQGSLPGFSEDLFSVENFRNKIIAREDFPEASRRILVGEFWSQYHGTPLSTSQQQNLESLASRQTYTVTTGHQLNLFTGPSFFVYKILQTIKTASFLKGYFPDKDFVPVFWMATEDHDFEEINHFRTMERFYEIAGKSGGAVGRIMVEDTYFIKNFEEEFKDTVYGTELLMVIRQAYQPGNTLAHAARTLVQHFFSEFGLLAIDGDSPALKRQMVPAFSEELRSVASKNSTKSTVDRLTEAYGKVQVNPRDINLFYLSETRDRIEKDSEGYKLVDKNLRFSGPDILKALEDSPEKFSPNALMRPVYQETVLPNIAYIGGNAEIMYWLELKDYFAHLQLPFPVLVPRNSMLMLPEKTMLKIKKLDVGLASFFGPFSHIIGQNLLSESPLSELINQREALLREGFLTLKVEAAKTDKTFRNLVEAEETRQLKSFGRMRKRLLRAEKIKHQDYLERAERLFLEVHPGKNWQERAWNFSVFYAADGPDWLHACLAAMDVEKSELIIMEI